MTTVQKRTETGTPYVSICCIVRNAVSRPGGAKRLEEMFQSVRERLPQAEIVVVDTMSSDETPALAKKYADVFEQWTGPHGSWTTEMPHFDDAAAARQRSFELASGIWRGWIDDDDRLAGPEEAERLLKLNNRWKPPPKRSEELHDKDAPKRTLEDALHLIDEELGADMVWAPYLYQRDKDGFATVWQPRERFVKWSDPPKFVWRERAHEILVPVPGHQPKLAKLEHLLYIHESEFDENKIAFNLSRHYGILLEQYNKGERTNRRCLYLAELCKVQEPQREWEFLQAAREMVVVGLDRFRTCIQEGTYFASRGLVADALEKFTAATQLRPDLPDAWLAGGEWWLRGDEFIRAIEWFKNGLSIQHLNTLESFVKPRDITVYYPALLSRALEGHGKALAKLGENELSLKFLQEASLVWAAMFNIESLGQDKHTAQIYWARTHNDERAQEQAMAIQKLAQYLLDNDEPLKAVALLKATPWNLLDHPIIIALERTLAPVIKHVTDEDAYFEFYNSEMETGAIKSPEDWMEPSKAGIGRVAWMAKFINEHCPRARVLDVGCFDGIVGIPLMRSCPGIEYVGIEPFEKAVEIFAARLETYGLKERAMILNERSPTKVYGLGEFDIVIFSEVIEHVPDPSKTLFELANFLKPDGHLLITTPWGSFDAGNPPTKTDHGTPRDPRGHVRVITCREMVGFIRAAGLAPVSIEYEPAPTTAAGEPLMIGEQMLAIAGHTSLTYPPAVRFAVPGSLWDWNSRTVHEQGMGASEETIVYLAKSLATQGGNVEVYGPVPRPEVHHRVRYYPREQLRHLQGYGKRVGSGKLVVSRSPTYGKILREAGVDLPMVLWLQDAWYPDLNEETSALYESIVVVSEWHAAAMHARHQVPPEKIRIRYNFLLPEHFARPEGLERKTDRFVYASSPDRGLVRLLELWPMIRRTLPAAELHVCYGWRGCERLGNIHDPIWGGRHQTCRRLFEELRHQPGVIVHGMINHEALALLMMTSGVWAYPSGDRQNGSFEETGCLAACKAIAAGMVPVCPPRAALAETAVCMETRFVDHIDDQAFVNACWEAAQVPEESRQRIAESAIRDYGLPTLLPGWEEILR